jgi:hypothetical protein
VTASRLHWGTVSEFIRDRMELNYKFEQIIKLPIEALGSPVSKPNPLD